MRNPVVLVLVFLAGLTVADCEHRQKQAAAREQLAQCEAGRVTLLRDQRLYETLTEQECKAQRIEDHFLRWSISR